jgi:tRNA A37 threonylcarbamoyladenosine synthetase subunit TsaC/SUA5/YrdC
VAPPSLTAAHRQAIAVPTDTLYGLAASATDGAAIQARAQAQPRCVALC